MKAKVAVLVPAHNEEDSIHNTIESLMRQTYPAHQIIVISDNSTDKTVQILEELVACYGHMGLTFFESVENKYKKGGALNQGFQKLDTEGDLVLTLDGDTILDANFLESGVEELASNSALGAVCARFRLNPFTGSNIFQHLLWTLQKLEYSWFDSSKIEYNGNVMVLSGAGALIRRPLLDKLAKERNGVVWTWSPADDYVLTLDLKIMGWKVGTIFNAYASTDAMNTFKDFYKQRHTWYLWSWLEIKRRGLIAATRIDYMNFGLVFVALLGQLYLIGLLAASAFLGASLQWHVFALLLILLTHVNKLMRLRYVQNRRWYEILLALTFIPEELYRFFLNILVVVCFWKSSIYDYGKYWVEERR